MKPTVSTIVANLPAFWGLVAPNKDEDRDRFNCTFTVAQRLYEACAKGLAEAGWTCLDTGRLPLPPEAGLPGPAISYKMLTPAQEFFNTGGIDKWPHLVISTLKPLTGPLTAEEANSIAARVKTWAVEWVTYRVRITRKLARLTEPEKRWNEPARILL